MEQKVLAAILEHRLLSAGEEATVALSGGADSVALLWVLRHLGPGLGIRLRAAHFHHGLRGEEADRDADFCRDLCAEWGIPFSLGRGDARARAAETGESLEEAARALRYAWLESVAPGPIATAHNADDNAETILLHLIRGSGPRGLGGIPPRRGRIVRPLLGCTRAEILDLLDRNGLPHVEDSSNAADDCLRNRLRHRVMPLLLAENPSLAETVGRTAALVRAEDAYLSRLAARAAEACRAGEGWSCAGLVALEPVLRRRVLAALLRDLGPEDPALAHVKLLESLLRAGPSARISLPGGWIARREYDLLLFVPASEVPERKAPEPWELPLALPGVTELPGVLGRILCSVTKNSNFGQKNLNTYALRCDMITSDGALIRTRRPGDRLTLPGGTKALKALMIDRKIPAARRDRLPVLIVNGKIAAVFGLGADPAFLAPEGEEALLVCWETGQLKVEN